MKTEKGFIKTPALILIIAGILILAGAGYFGFKQYQIYQAEKVENERIAAEKEKQAQALAEAQQKALDKAEQEIGQLKKQSAELQKGQQKIRSDIASASTTQSAQYDLPAIIKRWHPIIGFVYCNFKYTNGVTYQEQTGSGSLIIYPDGRRSVLTNKHVVTDDEGRGPSVCLIKFPGDETVFTAYTLTALSTGNADAVYLNISNPDTYLTNMTTEGRDYCKQNPELGEQVIILGYPGIGSQTDITATDGIISGYDGDYYITSAKVEHGNSGGAAIDSKNNCYLGIPTYAETGTVESLARILKWQAF